MANVLIKLPEVQALTTLSKSSIYAMSQQGLFPKQIRIGLRAVAWDKSSVETWINQRIAQQDNVEA